MKRGLFFVLFLIFMPLVSAHVGYVLEEDVFAQNMGNQSNYFSSTLMDISNINIIVITLSIALILYLVLMHNSYFLKEIFYIKKEASTYSEFIPWIARLGLGIALIGAGTSEVLISPILKNNSILASLEILAGFFLMAGFLVGPTVIFTIFIYLFAFINDYYILGNVDFFALGLVILALGNSKPGIDDLFGIKFFFKIKSLSKYVPLILRLGIGISMAFLAIYEKMLNPLVSEAVVKQYGLTQVVPVSPAMWVVSAGIIELLVGIVLILGFKTRLFSAIAFAILSLSFFYFNEAVYSHITLFATLSILFVTSGGKLSIDALTSGNKSKKK